MQRVSVRFMLTHVMHVGQQVIKVCHGSKERIDIPEVFHIVAKILHGRLIDRADPDCFDV